jgi:hypothetical protein
VTDRAKLCLRVVNFTKKNDEQVSELTSHVRRILTALAFVIGCAATASAQGWTEPDPQTDPWNKAQMKFGPVFLLPSFQLQNLGVDDNVFRNEANPKRDLTGTIDVGTIFGAHVKAFSLTFTQDNKYIWFRRYASERSIDGGLGAIMELRLNAMRPWVKWNKMKTHDRFGFEVDKRAGRQTPSYEAGLDLSFGDRTGMTVSYSSQDTLFDDQQFEGTVDLRDALNNHQTFAHANGRWQYSEMTDIVTGVEWTRTKFLIDTVKSARTLSYFGGIKTHGEAPIVGQIIIGYKTQRHDDPSLPDFKGLVVNTGLTFVAADRVKVEVSGDRDLYYSYEPNFPYYVQQGAGVNLTGRASTRLDLLASARGEWLRYSDAYNTGGIPLASHNEIASVYGVGFLYNAGGTTTGSHFGLTLERAERISPLVGRSYRNSRVLTNIKFSF